MEAFNNWPNSVWLKHLLSLVPSDFIAMALDPILSLSPRTGSRGHSPQRERMDPRTEHVLQDAALCHQADYWQSRCNDLKKNLSQVKAELASVLERERSLSIRNTELESRKSSNDELEDEAYELQRELDGKKEELRHLRKEFQVNHSEMKRRLDSALRNSKSKEDLCETLRLQLRSKVGELDKAKDELHELKKQFTKEQELHHRSTAELRAKLEALAQIRDSFQAKQQDFERQEELCHEAVAELSSLRLRLKAAQEEDSKKTRMLEVLQSENDLWIGRSSWIWPIWHTFSCSLCVAFWWYGLKVWDDFG